MGYPRARHCPGVGNLAFQLRPGRCPCSLRGLRALVPPAQRADAPGHRSLLAHPDYIAYFNELAGRHPERIVVDSDLDWGQDLPRLRDAVVDRRIDRLWIAYFGSTDLSRYPISPAIRRLPPRTMVKGWIAISKTSLKGAYGRPDDYAWLEQQTPVQEIGKSILLYHAE